MLRKLSDGGAIWQSDKLEGWSAVVMWRQFAESMLWKVEILALKGNEVVPVWSKRMLDRAAAVAIFYELVRNEDDN